MWLPRIRSSLSIPTIGRWRSCSATNDRSQKPPESPARRGGAFFASSAPRIRSLTAKLALLHVNVIDNVGKAQSPLCVAFSNADLGQSACCIAAAFRSASLTEFYQHFTNFVSGAEAGTSCICEAPGGELRSPATERCTIGGASLETFDVWPCGGASVLRHRRGQCGRRGELQDPAARWEQCPLAARWGQGAGHFLCHRQPIHGFSGCAQLPEGYRPGRIAGGIGLDDLHLSRRGRCRLCHVAGGGRHSLP